MRSPQAPPSQSARDATRADAREAGRKHLSDKRKALGLMLLSAEEEDGKHNEAADPEKPRGEASDEADRDAVKQTTDNPIARLRLACAYET